MKRGRNRPVAAVVVDRVVVEDSAAGVDAVKAADPGSGVNLAGSL
jgi:hypothetical protein